MKTFKIVCTAILLISLSAGAQEFRKSGTSGFVFLELPVTARYAALGEAGVTLRDAGSEGLFVNPALIAFSDSRLALNVSYAKWYVETSHQAAGLTYQLAQFGTIGVQAVYFDFGEVPRTQNFLPGIFEPGPGDVLPYASRGTYSAGAYAFGLSFARRLTDRFSFGASAKYVLEKIDVYDADNVVLDLGFLYLTGFNSLRIGAFLQSFGLETAYEVEKIRMPQQLKLEISAEVWGDLAGPNRLTLLAQAIHPNDAEERMHLGAEAVLMDALVLRGGYKFGYDEEDFTVGAGLRFIRKLKQVRLDLAYMQHAQLDNTVRTTLALEL